MKMTTESLVVIAIIVGFLAIVAVANWSTWFPEDEVILSRGAASALEPSYSFGTEPLNAAAGVYMRNGQPRYMLGGRDATAEEFQRARSADEWKQAQDWIALQRANGVR